MSTLLAHQGGWDEILYLVVPAVLVIGWLRWAERRARRRREAESPTANIPADPEID